MHVMRPLLLVLLLLCSLASSAQAELPSGLRFDWFEESQYAVTRLTYADRAQVRPGEEFTLAVQFAPFALRDDVHFHIYGPKPDHDVSYYPTTVEMINAAGPQASQLTGEAFPAGDNGLAQWGVPAYPEGELHGDQVWLPGQPVVMLKARLAADATPGKKTFYAFTTYMACTEEGCLLPSESLLSWEMEVVATDDPAAAVLSADEMLAARSVSEADYSLPPGFVPPVANTEDLFSGSGDASAGGAKAGAGLDFDNIQTRPGGDAQLPLLTILLLAFLGGLILNFMPCVLPVVSIKVISLVRQVEDHPKTVLAHGLMFSAGIIFMFLLLAVTIALIQAGGTQLGWGAQFQSAEFNLVMATLIFIFGLSLAGVFTIKPPALVTHAGEQLAEKEGLSGSFFKGALATVLGTPCVGPFLGPALGVAFTREWYDTIWIFLVVGVGMAVPYLLLLPFIMRLGRRERGTLSRKLQESKTWLVDFERVMAFLMFATVVYILHIFYGVVGGEALIWTLAFLVVIAFSAWLWGRLISGGSRLLPAAVASVLVVVLIGGYLTLSQITAFAGYFGRTTELVSGDIMERQQQNMPAPQAHDPSRPMMSTKHPGWEEFNIERLKYLTGEGVTVLIDFTADWCPNCKTNEVVALGLESSKQLASELGIVYMVADWTKKQKPDEIGSTLRKLGYASIPLTAIFPGSNPNSPILLDGLFSATTLHEKMREAAGVEEAAQSTEAAEAGGDAGAS